MKLYFFAAVLVCAAAFEVGEFDESMYETTRVGKRAKAEDDAQSTVKCGKHYTMKKCECREPADCDGAWIRSSAAEDTCVVWTQAAGEDNKVIGAVPVATCVRLIVTVESEVGQNPKVGCPEKYSRVGCNLHTYYRQAERLTMGVTQRNGRCETYGDCQQCRVQAVCMRNKDA